MALSPSQSNVTSTPSSPSKKLSSPSNKTRGSLGSAGLRSGKGIRSALYGEKFDKVKSAFAERAVYKDYLKQDGIHIDEDKSMNRSAEAVQVSRNRSSIRHGEILLERKPIPKEYFIGTVSRNPFAGTVYLHRCDNQFDFTHVDLFDRDYLMASPDTLSKDEYLFRPFPLGNRSWVYHEIIRLQECALRGEANHFGARKYAELVKIDILKTALALPLVDDNTSAYGRYSPFQPASVAMLLICLTVEIPLMFAAFALFIATFICTTFCNHPDLFRWHRFWSFPARFPVFIAVAGKLGDLNVYAAQGRWIPLLGVIVAFLILLFDHILGDFMSVTAFSLERHLEIQRTLPGGVYLCKVLGGEAVTAVPRGDDDEINPDIVGAQYLGITKKELAGCVLIVDIQGLLCELKPCSSAHWREQYRYSRNVLRMYSTRTFSNLRPDGEFFNENGTHRNLYEIMGLNNDGSIKEHSGSDNRKSFLGRRGTYQVSTLPKGAPPGRDGTDPPPPPDAPPPAMNYREAAIPPDLDEFRPTKQSEQYGSQDEEIVRDRSSFMSMPSNASTRPQSAPAGHGSKQATRQPKSGGGQRPQSAATLRQPQSPTNRGQARRPHSATSKAKA